MADNLLGIITIWFDLIGPLSNATLVNSQILKELARIPIDGMGQSYATKIFSRVRLRFFTTSIGSNNQQTWPSLYGH